MFGENNGISCGVILDPTLGVKSFAKMSHKIWIIVYIYEKIEHIVSLF